MSSEEGENERGRLRDAESSAVHRVGATSSTDLLDLVRAAEEEARVATPSERFAAAEPVSEAPANAAREEFVDVGDDAVDAPPSHPPPRAAASAPSTAKSSRPPPASRLASTSPRALAERQESPAPLPPAVAIALMFALAIGALFAVTR